MNLSPLKDALDHLETAVAGIADKIATAVVDTTSQDEVDQLVARAEGLAERLTGLAPAKTTQNPAPAESSPPVNPPAWTPEHPAS